MLSDSGWPMDDDFVGPRCVSQAEDQPPFIAGLVTVTGGKLAKDLPFANADFDGGANRVPIRMHADQPDREIPSGGRRGIGQQRCCVEEMPDDQVVASIPV